MNIRKKDRHETVFVIHAESFHCVRMTVGLANTSSCFQRTLDIILTNYKCKTLPVYLDDIISFSDGVKDHIRHFDEIITNTFESGVSLEINMCYSFQRKVDYLDHMIKHGQLEIDKTNFASLKMVKTSAKNATKIVLRFLQSLLTIHRALHGSSSTS